MVKKIKLSSTSYGKKKKKKKTFEYKFRLTKLWKMSYDNKSFKFEFCTRIPISVQSERYINWIRRFYWLFFPARVQNPNALLQRFSILDCPFSLFRLFIISFCFPSGNQVLVQKTKYNQINWWWSTI
jgi:hypothetical protein